MKKLKRIILTSSLALLLSSGGPLALASTEVGPENTMTQSVVNVSTDPTKFKGVFETNKSYEIVNNDEVNKLRVYMAGKSSNLWMYNLAIYKADGTIQDYVMENSATYFDIPAGGKIILTVTENVDYATVTMSFSNLTALPTIKNVELSALEIQKIDNANYYSINNHSDVNQSFALRIKDNYGKMKGIVLYDKNGVITDEYTSTLKRSFTIPAGGKAVLIPGVEETWIYAPTPRAADFTVDSTPIGDVDIRETNFDIKLQESPYLFNKVVKITNNGGDNFINIALSKNLKKVSQYSYKEYLKAGESMEIVVAPTSSDFANFNEYVQVKSGNGKTFTLPIEFKIPEVATKQPEVSELAINTVDNKETTYMSATAAGTTVEYTFELESFYKNEVAAIEYGKPLATTTFNDNSSTYNATLYRDASMLAYEGYPLTASDIITKGYKISSNIVVKSKDETFFEDYIARNSSDIIGELTDFNATKIAILFPFYSDVKTFFDDASKFDQLQYLSETGQIEANMTSTYVDELYLRKLMPSIEKNIESRQFDLAANTIIAISSKYMPHTVGIGALFTTAIAVKDWAIANVWDVWNENNAYWIGHNANTVMNGYYDSFRYLDTNGVIHEMSAHENKIIKKD